MASSALAVRSWNGTEIARRQSDGFVNATAMCKANGKRWKDYRDSDRCQLYLDALESVAGISGHALVESRSGGAGGGGTWVHPQVAVDLARWISAPFAVWMDGWFLESIATPQPTQLRLKPQRRPASSWSTQERLAVLSDPLRKHHAIQRICRNAIRDGLNVVTPRELVSWSVFGRCPTTTREMSALLAFASEAYGIGTMEPALRRHAPDRMRVNLHACAEFLATGDEPIQETLHNDPATAAEIADEVKAALETPSLIATVPALLRRLERRLPEWAILCA
jgi:hypothetical protein